MKRIIHIITGPVAFLAIYAASALLLTLLVGCASLFGGGVKPAPPIVAGQTQVWYGRMNTWAENEAMLKQDLARMEKGKTFKGYMIELLSWGRYSAYANDKAAWKAKTESAYKLLVKEARKRGMWVFVSIANDNSGSGKYGDKSPTLDKQQDLLNFGLSLVLSHGSKNVIVQPVAETQRAWSKTWEVACAKVLRDAGFRVVCNTGSRPSRKPSWADWNAWHPFKVTDRVPGDQVIVTDTGMIIQQLCYGLDGPLKVDAVQNYKNRAVAEGWPVVGFYHFKYLGSDPVVGNIKAAKDAWAFDWLGIK